jgi:hypothetical protein
VADGVVDRVELLRSEAHADVTIGVVPPPRSVEKWWPSPAARRRVERSSTCTHRRRAPNASGGGIAVCRRRWDSVPAAEPGVHSARNRRKKGRPWSTRHSRDCKPVCSRENDVPASRTAARTGVPSARGSMRPASSRTLDMWVAIGLQLVETFFAGNPGAANELQVCAASVRRWTPAPSTPGRAPRRPVRGRSTPPIWRQGASVPIEAGEDGTNHQPGPAEVDPRARRCSPSRPRSTALVCNTRVVEDRPCRTGLTCRTRDVEHVREARHAMARLLRRILGDCL